MISYVKEKFESDYGIEKILVFLLWLVFFSLLTGLIFYKVVFIASVLSTPTIWSLYGLVTTIFLVSRIPYSYLYKDEHNKVYQDSDYPNVSIIIPVKNEEKGIIRTIFTCINSRYEGKIECIVVDDGSTDNTKNQIIKAQNVYGNQIKLIAFDKHKGKREAMATGIKEALYDIVIFIDSDSFLAQDSIHHIVEHFIANEHIGAVSGNTKVENINTNLLTKMQSIKYAISFDIYKASESIYSSVTCCPGCFSAYRKKAVVPIVDEWKEHKFLGSRSTFGDDRGLTNFILREGWNIVYCQSAEATTMVPEKFSIYWRQQLRWKKSWIREGVFASSFMWKNRHPMAVFAFYMSFSFPFVVIPLVIKMIAQSVITNNPFILVVFISGFLLLSTVFALFVHLYHKAKNWIYIPFVSLSFVLAFIWQMPWAIITFRKTQWGTR
jgi:hyaluronan synthase